MNLLTKNCKKHVFLRGHEVSIPTQIWRDEKRETKRSQHFKGNKVLRLQIKDRLKHGKKFHTDNNGLKYCPIFPFTEIEKAPFKHIVFLTKEEQEPKESVHEPWHPTY